MDRGWLGVGIIGITLLSITLFLSSSADSAIPPTRAFSSVQTDAGTIQATSYNSQLIAPKPPYAQISDLTSQACGAVNTAKNVTLDTNDEIYQITHSVSSKTNEIKIQKRGIYQIIAVPQVGEVVAQGFGLHNFWMMKNSAKVANSNIKTETVLLAGTGETMTGTLNWVGYLNANDIISFQQSCTNANLGMVFTGNGVPPATPSVIISIAKLNW